MKPKMPRRFWSRAELGRLAKLYPALSTREVAKTLGRTIAGVYATAAKLGIAKTPEYLQRHCRLKKGTQIGRPSQFRKGQVPFNKGLRRPGWSPGRMRETQFKPGQRTGRAAVNWKPIGTILSDHEGYLRIKVRDALHGKEASGFGNTKVWPLLGRYVWEQQNGPIPPKHVVAFKDRNRANCAIENLELIPRSELARRNAMWGRYPPELAKTIMTNAALKRQIRRLANGKE